MAVPLRQLTGGVPGPRPAPYDEETRSAERFLAARRALRDNDNLFGPRGVIPLAMRQLAVMREASKSLRGRDRRELLLPQIKFVDLLGWLYQDSREYEAAARWLDRALDWAHVLGDDGYHRDRGVYLAREPRARAASGEHDRAAELAAQAVAVGAETGSARIFAELAAVRDATWHARESPAVAWFRAALSAARRWEDACRTKTTNDG